jgi:hypothetical protein
MGELKGNSGAPADVAGAAGAFFCRAKLVPLTVDAVLKDGELLQIGLPPLAMLLLQLLQNPDFQICIGQHPAEFFAFPIVLEVEIRQGCQKGLE